MRRLKTCTYYFSLLFCLLVLGAPLFAAGARSFDAGTDKLTLLTSNPFTDYPFSFVAWFNPDVNNINGTILGIGRSYGISTLYYTGIHITAGAARATARNTTAYNSLSTTYCSPGNWYHIVAVFTSATSRDVYLNGGSKGSHTTSADYHVDVNNIFIGTNTPEAGATNFLGDIAQAAMYNKALSAEEIALLSNGGNPNGAYVPGLVAEPNLVGWWQLAEENATDNAIDEQGNYTLTQAGSPAVVDGPEGLVYSLGNGSKVPAIMHSYKQRRNQ